ncbi:hypothetical protein HNS38_14475 [Lentimicrobium sp. L6]|uniref:hypothetical protein n=1 Tax=Lentimicrobium sp. L6 TaxID=2735916 RepID=UPI001557619C|nr:hypothetical protein [Lentimicrobium sp. L6]NPD85975.1 hypothetical protein [Lentimicrobium sp. L6]
MKNLLIIILLATFGLSVLAQQSDTLVKDESAQHEQANQHQVQPKNKAEKPKEKSSFKMNKVIIGGSLGFSFGSVTSVRINPLLGYKLTPKLTTGVTGLYEYNSYDYYGYGRQSYSNYGGSVFSRFRFVPMAYLHAEFSYINYELSRLNNEKYRQGVPFIFLGGGFAQRIGRNTFAYGQILFDVLQDRNSPYSDWAPFYSVGVSVGF